MFKNKGSKARCSADKWLIGNDFEPDNVGDNKI